MVMRIRAQDSDPIMSDFGQSVTTAILLIDSSKRICKLNQIALDLLGVPLGEAINQDLNEVLCIHCKHRNNQKSKCIDCLLKAAIDDCLQRGSDGCPINIPILFPHHTQAKEKYVVSTSYIGDGRDSYALVYIDRKPESIDTVESHESPNDLYRQLFQEASEKMVLIDADNGLIIDASNALIRSLKSSRGDIIGQKVETLQDIEREQFPSVERADRIHQIVTRSGKTRTFQIKSRLYQSGNIRVLFGEVTDFSKGSDDTSVRRHSSYSIYSMRRMQRENSLRPSPSIFSSGRDVKLLEFG
jgi:PAS domain-containing protein